jgi:hypothetical protein
VSATPVVVAVAVWSCLLVRYYLKVPRTKVRVILLIAALTPWTGFAAAVAKGLPVGLSAWLIAIAAAIPWLATGFKPELMIDAKYVHSEDATEEQQDQIDRYQLWAVLIVIGLVLVGAIVFWDRIPG